MTTERRQKLTLTIGEVARRTGLATSALRFYEDKGLIGSVRTPGNQRCYPRDVIRRVSFIRAAQRVGLSLEEIRAALEHLPAGRTPTREDWHDLSMRWKPLPAGRRARGCGGRSVIRGHTTYRRSGDSRAPMRPPVRCRSAVGRRADISRSMWLDSAQPAMTRA